MSVQPEIQSSDSNKLQAYDKPCLLFEKKQYLARKALMSEDEIVKINSDIKKAKDLIDRLAIDVDDLQKATVTAYAQDYLDKNPGMTAQELAESIQQRISQKTITIEQLINIFDETQPPAGQ